jgi:peptidoglycan hydrolase-like protein with peptidoglycan-binding domain
MSRSQWAWTGGAAPRAVTDSAEARTGRAGNPRGECGRSHGRVRLSVVRPVLILAASVLVAGLMPTPSLAHTRPTVKSNTHAKHHRRAGSAHRSARSHVGGHVGSTALRSDVTLAPGAGYYSPHGSAQVRALQLRLARAGDWPGPIDGRYGPLTEQAVRRFQAAHGLLTDGIAGPTTMAALISPTPVLYPGAGFGQAGGSPYVKSLQRRLRRLGFAPGPVDGLFGRLTTRAVGRFQKAHRLRVSGVVGARTGSLLREVAHHRHAKAGKHHRSRPSSVPISSGNATHRVPATQVSERPAPLPALPLVLLLSGLAAVGLGIALIGYDRTRRRVRRSREAIPLSAIPALRRSPRAERTPAIGDRSNGVPGGSPAAAMPGIGDHSNGVPGGSPAAAMPGIGDHSNGVPGGSPAAAMPARAAGIEDDSNGAPEPSPAAAKPTVEDDSNGAPERPFVPTGGEGER